MSKQYIQARVSTIKEQTSCEMLPDSTGKMPLIVLSYEASSLQHKFLKQCFEMQQFGGKSIWLLMSTWKLSYHLLHILSSLNVPFNSNVFTIIHDETYGIQLSEVYAIGPNSVLQHNVISTWGIEDAHRLTTFPKLPYKYAKPLKRSSMKHYKLIATSVSANKFYTYITETDSEFQVAGGYFGEIFKNLAQDLNFTYRIKFQPGYAYGLPPTDSNSTWTGVLGDIQRGEADLSACEVSALGNRLTFMDFTIPVHITVRRLFIHEGLKKLEMYSYFWPFQISIWITFIAVFFLFTIINTTFYRIARTQKKLGFLSNVFVFISIILQQGSDYPVNMPIRLVLHTCDVLFLVVHTAYSAKLTALAMLYEPPPPITDTADLLKSSSWRFGIINGSLEYNMYKTGEKNSLLGDIWLQKLLPFPENIMSDFNSGLSQVLNDDHYVFMGLEDSCHKILQIDFSHERACKVLALPKTYFIGGLSLGLKKYSPYAEIINYSLMKMRSSGILHRLKLVWIPQPQVCKKSLWLVTDLLDIVPLITAYCILFITSIFILIGELLLHNHLK
ncbi:hypothetical protein L9F63_009916, partial [Diploptera punctata]